MARLTDGEITGGLKGVLARQEKADSQREPSDGGTADTKVRKAIEDAIALQKQDPDLTTHGADREVLSRLHDALEAQLRDEATDSPY